MEKTTETKIEYFDKVPEKPKHCFLVLSFGCWGRGKTIKEAAQKCHKSGGQKKDRAIVRMVLNDETAEINNGGYMVYEPGSHVFRIGDGFKLGDLLKLED